MKLVGVTMEGGKCVPVCTYVCGGGGSGGDGGGGL